MRNVLAKKMSLVKRQGPLAKQIVLKMIDNVEEKLKD